MDSIQYEKKNRFNVMIHLNVIGDASERNVGRRGAEITGWNI